MAADRSPDATVDDDEGDEAGPVDDAAADAKGLAWAWAKGLLVLLVDEADGPLALALATVGVDTAAAKGFAVLLLLPLADPTAAVDPAAAVVVAVDADAEAGLGVDTDPAPVAPEDGAVEKAALALALGMAVETGRAVGLGAVGALGGCCFTTGAGTSAVLEDVPSPVGSPSSPSIPPPPPAMAPASGRAALSLTKEVTSSIRRAEGRGTDTDAA